MRTKKNPEIPMVPKIHLKNIEHQRDQYKKERGTLINDLKVLREKNEKLKNRAENAMELAERSNCGVLKLERENEKLRKQYTTLTAHIRLKASANPGEHRYIALVNFIDRLERD